MPHGQWNEYSVNREGIMFRFTIRDVFWLTVVVAVLVAWYLEYRSDALARHRDAQAIQYLKQELSKKPTLRVVPIPSPIQSTIPSPRPSGFRPVPGNWDFQMPPELERPRLWELEQPKWELKR